jgi:hypothetical protein
VAGIAAHPRIVPSKQLHTFFHKVPSYSTYKSKTKSKTKTKTKTKTKSKSNRSTALWCYCNILAV